MLNRLHDTFEQRPTTGELICALANRFDAADDLFVVLALMVELSNTLPTKKQYRMAQTLRDAAEMIESRPEVAAYAARVAHIEAVVTAFEMGAVS